MLELRSLQLAQKVVGALKWEVSFSPKPGLVDAYSNGSHKDMDIDLFYKSADNLLAGFQQMAEIAYQHPLDLRLREEIGRIGRLSEKSMFEATGGINTHKGAIWSLGLLISVISSQQTNDLEKIFSDVKSLSRMPDKFVPQTKSKTHGMVTKQKYALSGARGEAQLGFPNVSKTLSFLPEQDDFDTWMRRLLVLYSNVDDTNIVYRSNLKVLKEFQNLSADIVVAKQDVLYNLEFKQLEEFTQQNNISPGGCADLFAASYFLKHLN
ncbi:triphosphoribosyl-dephospho-CoA synthase [Companilactobacillus versmoldensis]|uniref:triphosphoribosyl-dephospho-CoA synthase n=1 Tax=Companilactobacillus versmoldensis TaxID=194326 RepID=UPI00024910F6|nr:triphosphoribosyl-dephospho-CoA synthase [Companilactobacillus versmoldensis]